MDIDISIHALLTEGDVGRRARRRAGRYFNPRPPHGGRHRFLVFFDTTV